MKCTAFLALALALLHSSALRSDDTAKTKKTIWQGEMHLGDDPAKSPKATSAGMSFQVPFRADRAKKARLTVTAADVQTQAGNGHYVEVIAHFEGRMNKAPAKEVVVETLRIKDKTAADTPYTVAFQPGKEIDGAVPDYFSVRIKIDSYIEFSFWDDFLVKRIELEQ